VTMVSDFWIEECPQVLASYYSIFWFVLALVLSSKGSPDVSCPQNCPFTLKTKKESAYKLAYYQLTDFRQRMMI